MNPLETKRRGRPSFLVLLAATIIAGLASRRLADSIPRFLADHAGDALWTLAAYFCLALVFPSARVRHIAAGALGISFLVEFSQLLDWPWLVSARKNPLGSLFLGQGFLAIDLLRYAVGMATGVAIDCAAARLAKRHNRAEI